MRTLYAFSVLQLSLMHLFPLMGVGPGGDGVLDVLNFLIVQVVIDVAPVRGSTLTSMSQKKRDKQIPGLSLTVEQ